MSKQSIMYGNDWTQFPEDTIVSDKEIITKKLNYHRAHLIERMVSFKEGLARYQKNPEGFMTINSGQLVDMPLKDVCEMRKSAVLETRSIVKILEDMHDNLTTGSSSDPYFSDENLEINIPSPLDKSDLGTGEPRADEDTGKEE